MLIESIKDAAKFTLKMTPIIMAGTAGILFFAYLGSVALEMLFPTIF